jgi:hypothetical protein
MDRDAHMDRQWVCGVYSQLEWFSNAPNALVIAVVAPFASTAVQRAYMRLPRLPCYVVHALCDVSAFPTSVLFLRAF